MDPEPVPLDADLRRTTAAMTSWSLTDEDAALSLLVHPGTGCGAGLGAGLCS
jgi:hypothetical protein